jgi:hypothetical protein
MISLRIFSALGLLGCCHCLISRKCGPQKKQDDEEEAALVCENNSTKRMKQVSSLIAKFEALSSQEDETESETVLSQVSLVSLPKSNFEICAVCQRKLYPTDVSVTYSQKTFHSTCFKCQLCCSKFSSTSSQVAEMVTVSNKCCMLICSRCQEYTASKYLPRKKSTPACQSIIVSTPEKGNIQQVKQDIGDDLEAAMESMIPLCNVCGMNFLGDASTEVTIVGMHKYHKECWVYGKPMVQQSERRLTPSLAARYTPEHLIVRMASSSASGDQTIMKTLFFILPDKTQDLKRIRSNSQEIPVQFEYKLDPNAYGNPNYHASKHTNRTATLPCGDQEYGYIAVELVGDPLGKNVEQSKTTILTDFEDYGPPGVFCAILQFRKFQLVHRFELRVPLLGSNATCTANQLLDLAAAKLCMNIAS